MFRKKEYSNGTRNTQILINNLSLFGCWLPVTTIQAHLVTGTLALNQIPVLVKNVRKPGVGHNICHNIRYNKYEYIHVFRRIYKESHLI